MLTVYIACAILGFGLILFSLLSGHDGHEHGDVGSLSADHGLDGGHASASMFAFYASVQFWEYLLATFGGLGLLLTWLKLSAEPITAFIAGVTAVAVGIGAASVFKMLTTKQLDSTAKVSDMTGTIAKVLVVPRENDLGKIRMTVRGDIIDVLAKASPGVSLQQGQDVVVVDMEGTTALVTTMDEIENAN
jgi:membrane protein implicated in regulation of membrane protease activity